MEPILLRATTTIMAAVAMKAAALTVFALALAACATVDATSTQYVGAPHPPPSDPAKVTILRSEPPRSYDRLGEVVVDASIDPAPPITQVEDKLRM